MAFSLNKGQKILFYGVLLAVSPILYYRYRNHEKTRVMSKKAIEAKKKAKESSMEKEIMGVETR